MTREQLKRHRAELAAYDRKQRAVWEKITNPHYDLICDLAELEGGPALEDGTPERSDIWDYCNSLPQFSRATRDKVWRETV